MYKCLLKEGRKYQLYIKIEVEGHLLFVTEGKVELKGSRITSHCGTPEKALLEVETLVKESLQKGYKEVNYISGITDPITLDNAKWHYEGDYPKGLSANNAYNHIGFFIGWLLEKDFFELDFKKNNELGIKSFKAREISSPTFFHDYMDGYFSTEDLKEEIIPFVIDYYNQDLSKSEYLSDYIQALCVNLPTVYHVEDTFSNYIIVFTFMEKKFGQWISKNENA